MTLAQDEDLWVFGYGSLIWRPGFTSIERHVARLHGWHRAMCLWSTRYRGTPAQPGLVLGLVPGGMCRGVAFRVAAAQTAATLAYLDARELPDGVEEVYVRRTLPCLLGDGRIVPAVAYVARRQASRFAGRLDAAHAAASIAVASGETGTNRDYLHATRTALSEFGIRDRGLDRLAGML